MFLKQTTFCVFPRRAPKNEEKCSPCNRSITMPVICLQFQREELRDSTTIVAQGLDVPNPGLIPSTAGLYAFPILPRVALKSPTLPGCPKVSSATAEPKQYLGPCSKPTAPRPPEHHLGGHQDFQIYLVAHLLKGGLLKRFHVLEGCHS